MRGAGASGQAARIFLAAPDPSGTGPARLYQHHDRIPRGRRPNE
jgi:hypothetical protein